MRNAHAGNAGMLHWRKARKIPMTHLNKQKKTDNNKNLSLTTTFHISVL